MTSILGQIFRTALLCGSLGLVLYLALSSVADSAFAAPAIGLVGSIALSSVLISLLLYAWRSGEFPEKFRAVARNAQPGWYWGSMIWYGLAVICLIALALLSLSNLIDALIDSRSVIAD